MSTTAILAGGAAATLGLMSIPLAVAVGVSPINKARNARHHAVKEAHADGRTAELVAQIRTGADYAALVDPDPDKLAGAAYIAAVGLAAWFDHHGHHDDLPLIQRVLNELRPILAAAQVPIPPALVAPPLTQAAALQLLLHRLREASAGLQQVRASIAGGAAAEAVRMLPDGCVVDFNPLTEHDPVWLHRAQAEWVTVAQRAGMGGWIRAVRA